jgi:hypothetical protein
MQSIFDWILENWYWALPLAVAIADRIIAYTPTKRDDLVWTHIKNITRIVFEVLTKKKKG